MRRFLQFLFAFCVVLIWLVGWPMYRNYQGYCEDNGVKLDDAQLVMEMEKAAYQLFEAELLRIEKEAGQGSDQPDTDTFEAFMAQNSECCSLIPSESLRAEAQIGALVRMQGGFRSWGRMKIHMIDANGAEYLQDKTRVIGNCGQVSSYVR